MVFVRDVMTKSVIVIDPERTVLDAAKRMAAKKIGGLVVVKYDRPIGLVTDRDILWKVTSTGRNPSKVLVRDIMTSPVATVSPLTTLRAAARVMLEEETRWLVVTRLDKGPHNPETPCPDRMAAQTPLDERVHLVPDVEDEDRSDRFAQAKDDRLHGHVDPRIER